MTVLTENYNEFTKRVSAVFGNGRGVLGRTRIPLETNNLFITAVRTRNTGDIYRIFMRVAQTLHVRCARNVDIVLGDGVFWSAPTGGGGREKVDGE